MNEELKRVMTEYDGSIFEELLDEGMREAKNHKISLTDYLLLRQLIILQSLYFEKIRSKTEA